MIRTQIVALVGALALLFFVLEMVRRRKLLEKFSLLWILGASGIVVLAASPRLLDRVAPLLGIAYPPAALFLGGLFVLAIVALHFSLVISKLTEQNRILAQKLALLDAEGRDRPDGSPPP